MLDRTDRSLVGIWWWTVDKWLLASALLLMTLGMILVMAASPAVASLINLSSQHFILRQLIYLGTGVADHAVGFDARAAPHSRPVACRAYSGDRIDDPRHCCRQ